MIYIYMLKLYDTLTVLELIFGKINSFSIGYHLIIYFR